MDLHGKYAKSGFCIFFERNRGKILKHADVVISGGGMVGLPLGLALAQGGLKTVVADAATPSLVLDPKFDGRVSALAYAGVRMLSALGVWEGLAPDAQPIREILVTDGKPGQPA